MSKVVYTSVSQVPLSRLISPTAIVRHLSRHRELIVAFAKRDFDASHRGTFLGLFWTLLTPLIMLVLFTVVFGYVFKGRFNQASANETPLEFALALFVGMSLFNCIGQTLGSAPGLMLGNAAYVKALSFPVEVLPVAAVLNTLFNLGISLGLSLVAILAITHGLSWSVICLPLIVACIALISLGLAWFLSSLSVFVRDVPAIVAPLSMILMFGSLVFFPITAVPKGIVWVFEINPIAILIEQGRGCMLYDRWPNPVALASVFVFSGLLAIGGYWVFMRTKLAFADVI